MNITRTEIRTGGSTVGRPGMVKMTDSGPDGTNVGIDAAALGPDGTNLGIDCALSKGRAAAGD